MKMKKDIEKDKDGSENNDNPMQKLEEALVICKFGRFQIILMVASLCAMFANVTVTTTASNILPSAECDLGMTVMQKVLLNAMPFLGQVGAALFTGFITDTFGRKIFLVGGHFGIFVCSILGGTAQSYWVLALSKFFEGIFLSLCYNVTSVMVSECTHKKARDRSLLLWSSFMPMAFIVVALLSWGILPQEWDLVIIEEYIVLHSWNIYLYVCSIWSLLAVILYCHLPESPKFLLSRDQENEALNVLKIIYRTNTGNDADTFPITSLRMSKPLVPVAKTSLKKQLVNAMFEVKNLFRRPLFSRLSLIMFINFAGLFSTSCLRMWYPQISTIVEEYQNKNGDSAQFCVMIDDYTDKLSYNTSFNNNTTETVCVPHLNGFETYVIGIIMGSISLVCYGINGYLVKYFGQKPLMFILMIICGFSSGAIYWTSSLIHIAVLFSTTCALMQTSLGLLYNVLVRVFPTSMRSLAFTLVTMAGRIGSLMGSILFPLMLGSACVGPFILLFAISIFLAGLVYYLPNPTKENNESGDG